MLDVGRNRLPQSRLWFEISLDSSIPRVVIIVGLAEGLAGNSSSLFACARNVLAHIENMVDVHFSLSLTDFLGLDAEVLGGILSGGGTSRVPREVLRFSLVALRYMTISVASDSR